MTLSALSTDSGPQGLDAAALGSAAAVVAQAGSTQALHWNPAGLVAGGDALAWDGGQGGAAGSLQQSLAGVWGPDPGLGLGLLVQDQRFDTGAEESMLGAAAAVTLCPGISVGTLQKFWLAQPGGLRGWSMDLGAQAQGGLGGWGRWHLGTALADGASALAWSDGEEELQPSLWRLGAAWEPRPGDWLALQDDRLDRDGRGSMEQWRAGLQAAVWRDEVYLRLGYSGGGAGTGTWASLGLGWHPWTGPSDRLDLDAAWQAPTGPPDGAQAPRAALSLAWRFGQPPPLPRLTLAQALLDDEGRLQRAVLALAPASPGARRWELDISEDSVTRRHLGGDGPPPTTLVWDGRDDNGVALGVEGLGFRLSVRGPGGLSASQGPLAVPPAPKQSAAPAVRPHLELKGAGELQVADVDFDVAKLAGDTAPASWELRIVDANGKAVRSIRGSGVPPKALHWEGTDDLGQPIADTLGASYQLRVTDARGQTRVAAQAPVVPPQGFADLASAARQEHMAWPSSVSPTARGGLVCSIGFEKGESGFTPQAAEILAQVVILARQRGLNWAVVEGHTDSEGTAALNRILSGERAQAVVEALRQGGLKLHEWKIVSHGDRDPLADNSTAQGRAQNRRVKVSFRLPKGDGKRDPGEGKGP